MTSQLARCAVGDQLPELSIPVDRTMIIASAIATQDYEAVHHDPGQASERGLRDIILSINATNGLIDRFVTEWSGPVGRISAVSLRLGVPMFAGDALTLRGEVTERSETTATVGVIGMNSDGVHVRALVTVEECVV